MPKTPLTIEAITAKALEGYKKSRLLSSFLNRELVVHEEQEGDIECTSLEGSDLAEEAKYYNTFFLGYRVNKNRNNIFPKKAYPQICKSGLACKLSDEFIRYSPIDQVGLASKECGMALAGHLENKVISQLFNGRNPYIEDSKISLEAFDVMRDEIKYRSKENSKMIGSYPTHIVASPKTFKEMLIVPELKTFLKLKCNPGVLGKEADLLESLISSANIKETWKYNLVSSCLLPSNVKIAMFNWNDLGTLYVDQTITAEIDRNIQTQMNTLCFYERYGIDIRDKRNNVLFLGKPK